MTLDRYLIVHKITSRQFADELESSLSAVRKWRQRRRIPRPAKMRQIKKITAGKVKELDWYRI